MVHPGFYTTCVGFFCFNSQDNVQARAPCRCRTTRASRPKTPANAKRAPCGRSGTNSRAPAGTEPHTQRNATRATPITPCRSVPVLSAPRAPLAAAVAGSAPRRAGARRPTRAEHLVCARAATMHAHADAGVARLPCTRLHCVHAPARAHQRLSWRMAWRVAAAAAGWHVRTSLASNQTVESINSSALHNQK